MTDVDAEIGYLIRAGVTLVLDVGANIGQTGKKLRGAGYAGRIASFEPIPDCFAKLQATCEGDPLWEAHNLALGTENKATDIGVSENLVSSSLLPATDRLTTIHAPVRYTRRDPVMLARLDGLLQTIARADDVIHLKIDTQGYERFVVEGAQDVLAQIGSVRMEVAVSEVYAGETILPDMITFMTGLGYILIDGWDAWCHPDTDEVLHFDLLFRRRTSDDPAASVNQGAQHVSPKIQHDNMATRIENFIETSRADGQKIERLIRRFYSRLPDRDVLIDGGAHMGYHTGFARAHFGRVISVEASPKTYISHIKIQINLRAPTPLADVIPVNAALGCRAGQGDTVDFFFSENHPGRSTVNPKLWDIWEKGEVVYEAPIRAAVLEIDDLKMLHATGRSIDFIKLDLEGNEISALRGAAATLRSDRPAVVMELGIRPETEDVFGETCEGFIAMMQDAGYDLFTPWATAAEDSIRESYPYWYVFALPTGPKQAAQIALLEHCFDEAMAEPVS